MVSYAVNGGTKKERKIVEDAFLFALKELMPRKKNLDVEFTIRKFNEDADGWHLFVDRGEHEIDIAKGLSEEDLATVVFHEMVHLKQYERGQLKDNGIVKSWNGEEYIYVFSTVDEYKQFPWEEEAYRVQEDLYTKWIQM